MVTATDPNNDTLTYRLGGADAASFGIVRSSGQLQTKAALDKETQDTYMVEVTATDPRGLSATVMVAIKVTDMAEAPEVTGEATVNYAENGKGPVATYTATDDEDDKAGKTLDWSLGAASRDAEDFRIEDGVLTFAKTPDFEAPTGGGRTATVTSTA